MENQITRNWWMWVVRGVVAIVFGILAYVMPGITLASLVLLFGAYALVNGVFAIAATLTRRSVSEAPWWATLLEGVIGVAAGIVTFMWPGITTLTLLYLIAAWSLLTGVLEIAAAIRLRKEIKGEWLLGLSGVLSILLAVALAIWPVAGVVAVVWMLGAYAIVFGGVMIGLGMRLRKLRTHADNAPFGDKRLVFR